MLINHFDKVIYTAVTIGKLSQYVKKYNNTGIRKRTFYDLKWHFIYYLCRNCKYETGDITTLSNENLFRMKFTNVSYTNTHDAIYTIVFNLNNYILSYNVKDKGNILKKYIPVDESISEISLVSEIDNSLCIDEKSVYVFYSDFIKWCGDNKWYFLKFDTCDANRISYDFLIDVYKSADYAIFIDPYMPIRIIMTRDLNAYVYYMNSKGEFCYHLVKRYNLPMYLDSKKIIYHEYIDTEDDPFKKYYTKHIKKYKLYKVYDNGEKELVYEDPIKERLIAKQNILNHKLKYNNINNLIYKIL